MGLRYEYKAKRNERLSKMRYAKGLLYSHFFIDFFLSVRQTILLDHAVHLDCYLLDTVSNRIYHVILTTSDVYFFFCIQHCGNELSLRGSSPPRKKPIVETRSKEPNGI